jgi:hypothetical protein
LTGKSATAAVSASEQHFDLWRRSVGLFAGPVLAALVLAWPLAVTQEAHYLAAIVSLVVVWWVTEAIPIPVTAVLGAALAALFGIATPTEAFAPFAEPIMFLFIGSFMLLFVLPVNWRRREFTIGWKEASKIDWGTILLLGGGFSLGRMMFETGLAEHIANGIIGSSGNQALWAVTALATLLGVVLDRDHVEHGCNFDARARRHLDFSYRGHRSSGAGDRHLPRCKPRLHAADLDSIERDRIRHGPRASRRDDRIRYFDGRYRLSRDPDRPLGARAGLCVGRAAYWSCSPRNSARSVSKGSQ